MKRNIAIVFASVAMVAASAAANAGQALAPVAVNASVLSSCTPPNSQAVCAAWHKTIRRNFSEREIGMLFGARTSYPNYNASYDRVMARYTALSDEFAATHAADLSELAAK